MPSQPDSTSAALHLLQDLIRLPSFSRSEDKTADLLADFLAGQSIPVHRKENNVWAFHPQQDPSKPYLLLNSHHDTVHPNASYTLDPFLPDIKNDKLYGLGSNDAGGCLVSLLFAFLHFYEKGNLAYNLVFVASAEEEISGQHGIEMVLPELPPIACGLVGEPTLLQMAVAERGLMVLDVVASGRTGHAARNEGDNALYKAVEDICWMQNHSFDRVSDLLGPVKLTVTSFQTQNRQHNVVPEQAEFVVDVRVNELYSFEEILHIIQANINSAARPRSMRLQPSKIALDHPLVTAGLALGKTSYGSPTTSDMALMPFPTLKMGPGDSARSHMADEYIYTAEIADGIETYIAILNQVL